jgi:hypothetical protein
MTKTTTITINGRLYDAVTGMPVVDSTPKPVAKAVAQPAGRVMPKPQTRSFSDIAPKQAVVHRAANPGAQTVHQRLQKSETLYRKPLKKPEPVVHHVAPVEVSGRSPMISRYGSNVTRHTELERKVAAHEENIKPAQQHPSVTKALEHQAAAAQPQLTGQALKEQLIKERLATVDVPTKQKRKWFARRPRLASILASSLAVLILGGYITYMNLPMISMKVAASRAGVNASMPNYRPDGYGLDGPITYSPGQVNINYKSTTNDSSFKLTQAPSNWDSQAVLDNYVTKQTETYLTFQERGIKVYTFDNKAAWVNGGLLYTIEGTASLSSDQVLRLATSM